MSKLFASENQRPAPLLAALALVALVPAVGVLWFMSVAMRNERLAVQERLSAVYANHLASLQPRVTAWVKERQAALVQGNRASPPEVFAALVRAGVADGIVVFDSAGKPLYPSISNGEPAPNENTKRARAMVAKAADLLKTGEKESALALLGELARDPNLRDVAGAQGALLVPDAQLFILKTLAGEGGNVAGSGGSPHAGAARAATPSDANRLQAGSYKNTATQVRSDLVARLNDYTAGTLPSGQRRFLMREVQALGPMVAAFPTLAAEELAADYLEHDPAPWAGTKPAAADTFQRTPLAKLWRLPSTDRTVLALLREDRLCAELAAAIRSPALPDVLVTVRAPDDAAPADKRIPSTDASELLPGWRLALSFDGVDPLASASERQSRFYLWSGFLMVMIIAVVALLVARYVSAQMRLTRLKDELVSTVSHELRTPIASMRALLDTLSAGRYRDDAQRQRYLHLATKENLRLSHLIDNFLMFSRLARGQQRFEFAALAPAEVVRSALEAVGEKLTSPPCRLTTRLAPDLPAIRGDASALSTVLVNLLDNAYKYTNGEKHIEVQTQREGDQVVFAIVDNGIGIAPEQQGRIFERFYQIDHGLTRQRGGCGLGLSIVQSIVRAHGGVVEVSSTLGQGSAFLVKIPQARFNA